LKPRRIESKLDGLEKQENFQTVFHRKIVGTSQILHKIFPNEIAKNISHLDYSLIVKSFPPLSPLLHFILSPSSDKLKSINFAVFNFSSA
jgi:hypothetical protein